MFKFSDELVSNNKAYYSYLRTNFDREKIEISRYILLLSIGLTFFYFIVDRISISENYFDITFIRASLIANLSGIFLITFKESFFLKHYQIIAFYGYLYTGVAIIIMIYLSAETDLAYSTYFAGLLLTVIAAFPFSYMSSKVLIFLSLLLVFLYAFVLFFLKGDKSSYHLAVVANNSFFLLGGVGIGLLIEFMKKRYIYSLFKLEHRLKQSLMNRFDTNVLKIHKRDELTQFLKTIKGDADLCHTRLNVNTISIKSDCEIDVIENIVASSLPYKFYTVNFDEMVFMYIYLYEEINVSLVKQIEKQVEKVLKEQVSSEYEHRSFMNFELDDMDSLLLHYQTQVVSNVVTLN